MLPISRRAHSAIRAIHLASSCPQSITAPSIRILSRSRTILLSNARPFSSITSRLQQAAASVEPPSQSQTPEEDGQPKEYKHFHELQDAGLISPRIIDTITKRMNIHTMTEVQQMTLNHCLDGSDVIAQARTGTGKTLAFLMPIVQRILSNNPPDQRRRGYGNDAADIRALIISPTRELAEQIAVEARKVVANTSVKVQTAVGGTQKTYHLRQIQQQGCHILVGTPGRVLDLLSDNRSGVSMENIETFVLDEADRLLDIGFAPAIADIQSYMPDRAVRPRQTLMFSATVPQSVVKLVRETLKPDFKFIRTVDPAETPTHERIPQHVVFGQGLQNQMPIIMEIAHNAMQAHKNDPQNNMPFKAIVFYGSTAEVALAFDAFSQMRDPDAPRSIFQPHPLDPCRIFHIHGKLAQAQRTQQSQNFRNSKSAILLSSDVTARGMDFPDVTHVIQIGLPKSSDDYVHRIGRTGRAGKAGEGWLILNGDERRDIDVKMRNSGINLREAELVTANLDMTRGAQVPANIARLLKLVEVGVKSVPYNVKAATYSALLGVLQQQNSNRSKQKQIDMMNELAKYGWGMQEPPSLSRSLISKIGFSHVDGIRLEDPRDSYRERDSGRDQGRRFGQEPFGDRGRDQGRSFGRPLEGKGVFGGSSSGGDAFDRMGFGNGSRSDSPRFGGARSDGARFGGGRRR